MGLIFPSRRRRGSGFSGLVMLLLIVMAGAYLFAGNAGTLLIHCQNVTQSMRMGAGLCASLGSFLDSTGGAMRWARDGVGESARTAMQASTDGMATQFEMSGFRERLDALRYRLSEGQSWVGGNPLAEYVAMDAVKSMVMGGGMQPSFAPGPEGVLRNAMNHFAAGQMSMQKDPSKALELYKKGAGMGEYGVMSQLALGTLYMGGEGGLPSDPKQAFAFNSEALSSLNRLESSGTPQANALLRGMPIEPTQLRMQLEETLRSLQGY